MIHIANFSGQNLHSNEIAKRIDMSISSIARALATLIEKDYVEKTSGSYRLIVPIYKSLLLTTRA